MQGAGITAYYADHHDSGPLRPRIRPPPTCLSDDHLLALGLHRHAVEAANVAVPRANLSAAAEAVRTMNDLEKELAVAARIPVHGNDTTFHHRIKAMKELVGLGFEVSREQMKSIGRFAAHTGRAYALAYARAYAKHVDQLGGATKEISATERNNLLHEVEQELNMSSENNISNPTFNTAERLKRVVPAPTFEPEREGSELYIRSDFPAMLAQRFGQPDAQPARMAEVPDVAPATTRSVYQSRAAVKEAKSGRPWNITAGYVHTNIQHVRGHVTAFPPEVMDKVIVDADAYRTGSGTTNSTRTYHVEDSVTTGKGLVSKFEVNFEAMSVRVFFTVDGHAQPAEMRNLVFGRHFVGRVNLIVW